jgi:hypothetical protein
MRHRTAFEPEITGLPGRPQRPAVQRAVMACAEEAEVVHRVLAAVLLEDQVVDVEEPPRATARHDAASLVAVVDHPTHERRRVLMRPRGRVRRAQPLRVARGHLEHRVVDRDAPALRVLLGLGAAIADRERDLVARAALVRRALERAASQLEERVVFRFAAVAAKELERILQRRPVSADNVTRRSRVSGTSARRSPGSAPSS